MKGLPLQKSTLALFALLVPIFALFVYVALRSGPLAPVPVVLATVEERPLSPALFGIGTIEARYTYRIGPTFAGRVKRLDVHVGDMVEAGQELGGMDPVDLDERIRAGEAALKAAKARLEEAKARRDYAALQARRYERLLKRRSTTEEVAATRRQELKVAEAGLKAAREETSRLRSERRALLAERDNLRLFSPVNGLVTSRNADPGTTVVAGESVVEIIDPESLWVNVRFDQIHSEGLKPGLPVRIVLRSRRGETLSGRILRIEPLADAVTEEMLAKVVFESVPRPLPSLGELAEVTVMLARLSPAPLIPNAAIRRIDGVLGVWVVKDMSLSFTPIVPGRSGLDGMVQVKKGLKAGDHVVVYSEKALGLRSRIKVVDSIVGGAR